MTTRPQIITDQIGYIRDIIASAMNKLPPIQERVDVDIGSMASMCVECIPLVRYCNRCSMESKIYNIENTVYHVYSELSQDNIQQYIDFILEKLEKLEETTYVSDIIRELEPFAVFVNIYSGEVIAKENLDTLIISYINGYFDYAKTKYIETFERYNIDICRVWYTSIFEATNMFSILLSVMSVSKSYPEIDWHDIIDSEFELCDLVLHFMVESAQETPRITLNLPKCFTIEMITRHSVEYGFHKDNTEVCLFSAGHEEMVSKGIEIGELEKIELFCLYKTVPGKLINN